MSKQPAIAVFDVGKTNKKLLLFNEQYQIIFEQSLKFDETQDEDGFPCEDILALTEWVKNALADVMSLKYAEVKAINFSAYGASFVHVDREGRPIAPLYNYLKPFPEKLKQEFYNKYGGEIYFSQVTASPVLGNLNSGLQLYWLKKEQPELFNKIFRSLHLPQYLSSIITQKNYSDITSIGCHTALWDFQQNHYHDWVYKENIISKLAGIFPSDQTIPAQWGRHVLQVGIGMHDSSSALIPYLLNFSEPFILLSTGTWNISLNPFNQAKLNEDELKNDCLCYMEYRGKPIKAARLFAGYEHETQTKKLAAHFHFSPDYYKTIAFDATIISKLSALHNNAFASSGAAMLKSSEFAQRKLSDFGDYETAYHQLMLDIIAQQVLSTNLVMHDTHVKKIFVDGGFSKNTVFMNLLAMAFPKTEVYASAVAQASSIGTALAIHKYWNDKAMPEDMFELKLYAARHDTVI
jgi:sugar (pentulose or hexulose) kinase